ncbi:MAG TPA: Type 1 glutamine amidotransferase-like domain-containing protein [Candidatus Bipolaricaulota bacterium]|nr:Type 1 glutamine amidotransferase-like domain-containing protein [Candidatus Bipolaricaulota bacterium]
MQKIKEKNRIYLSGGGNEKQSFLLDKFFFSTLPVNGRFLYVPIALRDSKIYLTVRLWMNSVIKLHERDDIQFEVIDDPSKYKFNYLINFNGIYIGGGNTWDLMDELKNSGFADALIKYYKSGGQVYGGSAGAIILGKRIDTQDDKNKIGLQDNAGLNLLHDFSVACHFKNNQNNRFKSWAMNNNLPIVCLSEGAGMIIENNVASCIGERFCTIYSATGVKTDISSGGLFNL